MPPIHARIFPRDTGIRRRPRRLLVVVAAGATLATLPAVAEARIVPGRSVAGVSLDDTAAKVKSVLGAPEAGSNVLNYKYLTRHGLGVYFIGGRAFEISVLRGKQATGRGIKIGSSKNALLTAYPAIRCRAAVVGARLECRLPARFKKRASETVFTTTRDKVVRITVHFS